MGNAAGDWCTVKNVKENSKSSVQYFAFCQLLTGEKTNPNAISPGKVREAPETAAEEEQGGNLNLNNPPTFHWADAASASATPSEIHRVLTNVNPSQ